MRFLYSVLKVDSTPCAFASYFERNAIHSVAEARGAKSDSIAITM